MSGAPAGDTIRDHYETAGLADRLLAEIADPAIDIGPALDQFHVGGAKATKRLIARIDLPDGARVLDVGSGLGGPARLLASARGWDVTGIDLSPEFSRVATALSARAGVTGETRLCAADALYLPFPDGAFDAIWTEHVAMNIGARDALYAELARVVGGGGLLALYDIVAGEQPGELSYPVHWARAPGNSHLVDSDTLRTRITEAGWTECVWEDETVFARDWLENARPPGGATGPTLRQVMGEDFPSMLSNLRDNFSDGRLGAVQAVFQKTT
jgi:sarcosine/dimethylglycine N-methyltransferase